MKKTNVIKCFLLVVCLLSGCHENPLKAHKEEVSTRFLINASIAAAKRLHLGLNETNAESVYPDCMEGQGGSIDCQAFYQAMVIFAKEGKFPGFKRLNVADLCDKAVFDILKEGYSARVFFNNTEN